MTICDPNTTFKNINNIGDDYLLNILESNFKMFLDWSFLNIGGWFDVNVDQQNLYGGNPHAKLVPVEDPSYSTGQVWQSARKDWVWESTVSYNNSSPISVSGVYLNDTLITDSYFINYPLGQIVLEDPIPTSTPVEVNYSYRFVQTYRANDAPWFNVLQFKSYYTDNKDIITKDEGEWSIGGYRRIQMPCIIIESLPRSRSLPYELGSGGLLLEQDIMFYILAENKNDRNKLLDILRLQQDSVIYLFDTNKVASDDRFPLDHNGSVVNNPLYYPNLVDQYKYRKCWFKNVSLVELTSNHPNLHTGAARLTAEIIFA